MPVHLDGLYGRHDWSVAWSKADIDLRTEELLVDAYGDHEQLGSFECVLDEMLVHPVSCAVLGRAAVLVSVEAAGRGLGLRASVELDGSTRRIDLLDVTLPPEASADLRLTIACFERWATNL